MGTSDSAIRAYPPDPVARPSSASASRRNAPTATTRNVAKAMRAMHSVLRPGRYPAPRMPSHRMPESPGDAASDARGRPSQARVAASDAASRRIAPPKKPGTSGDQPGRRGGGEAGRRGEQDDGQPPTRRARRAGAGRTPPASSARGDARARSRSVQAAHGQRAGDGDGGAHARAAPARREGSARACPRRPTHHVRSAVMSAPAQADGARDAEHRAGQRTGSPPRTGRAGGGGRARSRPRASGPAPARAARGRGGRRARRAAARTTTRKKLK